VGWLRPNRLVLACVVAVVGLPVAAIGPAPARATTESPAYCATYADYFTAQLLVGTAAAFAQGGGKKAAQRAGATYALLLSPRLADATADLVGSGPPELRSLFRSQERVYRKGVALLRAAGLTPDQITELEHVDFAQGDTTDQALTSQDLDTTAFRAKVTVFVGFQKALDLSRATRRQKQTLAGAAGACGVLPDPDVDCGDLLTDAEVTSRIGPVAGTDVQNGCLWAGAAPASGDRPAVGVSVFAGDTTYNRITRRGTAGTPVTGVGDAATLLDGFQGSSSSTTCGQTLVVLTATRTVAVAVCAGAAPVATDDLVAMAQLVLPRL
jgi:hypothetical protein